MKKVFVMLAAFGLGISTPVMAQEATASTDVPTVNCKAIDATKLADQQYVEGLKKVCPQEAASLPTKVNPDDVRKWASLGRDFGNAVNDTAKGLGVTVNDFLTTPAGILIAFYFLWDMIGGIIVGVPLLIFIWFLYFHICHRYIIESQGVEYENVPVLFGLWSKRTVTKVPAASVKNATDFTITRMFLALPALFISALILGTLIF